MSLGMVVLAEDFKVGQGRPADAFRHRVLVMDVEPFEHRDRAARPRALRTVVSQCLRPQARVALGLR